MAVYQEGMYPPAALISAMQALSVASEVVDSIAKQIVPASSP